MFSVFVSSSLFEQLQQRYAAWCEQGFPDIDEGMRPLVERLNRFPGVVTVSSCVGHQLSKHQLKTPFYIYMAAADEAARQQVSQVYDQMARRLLEVNYVFNENKRLFPSRTAPSHALIPYQNWQLTASLKDVELQGENITYGCVALIAKGTHVQPHRSNLLKELELILDKLLAAQPGKETH